MHHAWTPWLAAILLSAAACQPVPPALPEGAWRDGRAAQIRRIGRPATATHPYYRDGWSQPPGTIRLQWSDHRDEGRAVPSTERQMPPTKLRPQRAGEIRELEVPLPPQPP